MPLSNFCQVNNLQLKKSQTAPSVVSRRTGPGACRRWGVKPMHQQQTGAPSCLHATKVLPRSFCENPNHSFQTVYLDTIDQTESIPYRGSNPSPFIRISWNQMPGGGGAPEKQSHKPGATTVGTRISRLNHSDAS